MNNRLTYEEVEKILSDWKNDFKLKKLDIWSSDWKNDEQILQSVFGEERGAGIYAWKIRQEMKAKKEQISKKVTRDMDKIEKLKN